jgi:hypothetical protein
MSAQGVLQSARGNIVRPCSVERPNRERDKPGTLMNTAFRVEAMSLSRLLAAAAYEDDLQVTEKPKHCICCTWSRTIKSLLDVPGRTNATLIDLENLHPTHHTRVFG